ncbi:hypothetical protein DK419_25235 [Methylobacterium terrae]|uniref:Uncharacterized protein n=1 Tax=Methylobacterium terrae TaxID=2202827 RepID=A0A2U8WVF6_9HYPH|nr:hypothetical protein DK419_25235 [Methylobacterium terrae]
MAAACWRARAACATRPITSATVVPTTPAISAGSRPSIHSATAFSVASAVHTASFISKGALFQFESERRDIR